MLYNVTLKCDILKINKMLYNVAKCGKMLEKDVTLKCDILKLIKMLQNQNKCQKMKKVFKKM